ncbi:N-succinylarginine dihydrolase [Permianibacter aggregans]|uniref:N-succinylarginine dihydrolase n=1 Tax=Permianibacter aggregans TaxID=1510150 RepID=A0A4R6UWJ6_9GAMM|nr:N-succinylarginine dihydrolase [Permianibacter aggregans]QGX38839.1 N-succinylarginine dihydrolase [Permianibacter aggregans]TDQ50646.1 succinylarginine dihydrolase [Permianibacter aggregans]
MSKTVEINFDGLVGPTHNYAGLSWGNVASMGNKQAVANPREAVKQGLEKMYALHKLGIPQAFLPPLLRPHIETLRRLGYSGTDAQVLNKVAKRDPVLLACVNSASSMWTANACTMSPSADSADGKVHFTAANLANRFHRSIEGPQTSALLKKIFADERYFVHHDPLPLGEHFGDEGAANHTRLCSNYGAKGLQLFVYGKEAFNQNAPAPKKYPARQTKEASEAIARLHQLDETRTLFIPQNPDVIDQGVFHNDVIAVGNGNVLFCHEQAFLHPKQTYEQIKRAWGDNDKLFIIRVSGAEVSVEDAVRSYLFNSQLVTLPSGDMAIIVPGECHQNPRVWNYLQALITRDTPVKNVHVFDVKQSMRNGGGPACLRQRVVLSAAERSAIQAKVFIDDHIIGQLHAWADNHYREQLSVSDLADPELFKESLRAQEALGEICGLPLV